jgi:hypothetical protein
MDDDAITSLLGLRNSTDSHDNYNSNSNTNHSIDSHDNYISTINQNINLKNLYNYIIKITNVYYNSSAYYTLKTQYNTTYNKNLILNNFIPGNNFYDSNGNYIYENNNFLNIKVSDIDIINIVANYSISDFKNKFPESDLSLSIKRALIGDEFEQAFIQSYFSMLDRKFSNDKIFRGINNLIKNKVNLQIINDAFSRGQVKSKIWLIEELAKVKLDYSNVVILAGWFGQLKSIYDN